MSGPLPSLQPTAAGKQRVMAGKAVSLQVVGNPKLSGTLPASWASALVPHPYIPFQLDLSNNALTGTIPDAWSTIKARQINLAGNKLSGSISRAWAQELGKSNLEFALLNVSGNAGMKGCLADAKGQPWESLPFIDARGTQLLDCIKRQPALTKFGSGAPQPGWSPASCDVAGYEFKPRQLPEELSWQEGISQQVLLYTIKPPNTASKAPFPLASVAKTAAACDALDACVMFTSDGYLIGVYRPVTNVAALSKILELEKQVGPWQWRPMRYCSGKCCGTWLSKWFDAKTLTAAGPPTPAQSGGFKNASALAQPPSVASEANGLSSYGVNPNSERCAAMRAGAACSFTCPPRCRVACCAKEDVEYFAVKMSIHPFWQCSVQACLRSCGFELIAYESPTYTQQIVALYLAQKSRGNSAKASGARKTGGSEGCTGSLC
jgi:hypothetical protein